MIRRRSERTEAHVKQDVIDCLGRDPEFMGWNHPTGTFFTQEGHPVRVGKPGSFDTIWVRRVRITPDMVGGEIGVAVGVETKHPTTGGQRDTQKKFQAAWEMRRGIYVLTRDHTTVKGAVDARIRETIEESREGR